MVSRELTECLGMLKVFVLRSGNVSSMLSAIERGSVASHLFQSCPSILHKSCLLRQSLRALVPENQTCPPDL